MVITLTKACEASCLCNTLGACVFCSFSCPFSVIAAAQSSSMPMSGFYFQMSRTQFQTPRRPFEAAPRRCRGGAEVENHRRTAYGGHETRAAERPDFIGAPSCGEAHKSGPSHPGSVTLPDAVKGHHCGGGSVQRLPGRPAVPLCSMMVIRKTEASLAAAELLPPVPQLSRCPGSRWVLF